MSKLCSFSQFNALRSISTLVRRPGARALLDGSGARTYVDALLESTNELLVTRSTVTAALTQALDNKHLELQSKSTGTSKAKRSRDSDSGSESGSKSGSSVSSGSRKASTPALVSPRKPLLLKLRLDSP